jgi:predicted MFS family arabinose efflux permease
MGRRGYLAVAVLAGAALAGVIVLATAAVETDAGFVLMWLAILAAIAIGAFAWGRWRAVFFIGAAPWLILSLGFDAVWMLEISDFREDEREPLPLSMFVIPFGIPTFAAAAVLGVALRRAYPRSVSWIGANSAARRSRSGSPTT